MAKSILFMVVTISMFSCLYANPTIESMGKINDDDKLEHHNLKAENTIEGKKVKLMEGDIIKPEFGRSFGLGNTRRNWPNGVVPYVISSSSGYTSDEIAIIRRGMELITEKTGGCITFREQQSSDRNYITIKSLGGCYSYVGVVGYGSQDVSLARRGCIYKGTVVHELMHALGFHHEQNRPDRDQYIRVSLENVDADQRHNFDIDQGQYFDTRYDLKSIMQYSELAFSTNGRETITPLNGEDLIPAYDKTEAQILTDDDIKAVRSLYQCSGANTYTTSQPVVTTRQTGTLPAGQSYSLVIFNDKPDAFRLVYLSRGQERSFGYIDNRVRVTINAVTGITFRIYYNGQRTEFTLGEGIFINSGERLNASDLV